MADIIGTEFDDIFEGTSSEDFISGEGGDDIIQGNASYDTLLGGAGDDVLDGGESADVLDGGTGDDTIVGAHGNDTLIGDGEFDDTVLNVTVSQSDTIAGTGQTLAVSLTAPEASADDSYTISGFVSASEVESETINVALVIDVSGSTANAYVGTPVGDLNGDGVSDTFLDAEIAGALALIDSIVNDAGFADANIGLIAFENNATTVIETTVTADVDNNGIADIEEALVSLVAGGGTEYAPALQGAIDYFNGQAEGENYVFFLSDGFPFYQDYGDESAELRDALGLDATINAYAVGTNASEFDLDLLDDGVDNDSAVIVSDPGSLSADITSTGVQPEDVLAVEIYLDGVLYATIPSDQLVSTPLGLKYELELVGLSEEEAETIEVVAVASDDVTEVSVELVVGVQEVAGDDVLIGGEGSDDIFAGAGDDLAIGGGADDYIEGAEGMDTLLGDEGDDTLIGGKGADVITGSDGEDLMFGDAGDDIIKGGRSFDWLEGGKGHDTMNGGNGTDVLFGEDGHDLLRGAAGNDEVYGGGGNDLIYGGNGHDLLIGNGGNDVFDSGGGRDTMTGGAGADTFLFLSGNGKDVVTDFNDAQADEILLDLSFQVGAESAFDLAASVASVEATGLLLDFGGDELFLEGVFDVNDLNGYVFYA